MDELFKLLGLGTPFLYAGATYGLFHWLDVSASDEAKEALSTLIRVREYDKTKVSSAILEVFDRIYTHPLLTFRAFLRSTMITVLITGVFAYELWDAVIDERTKPWIVEHKYAFTVMMASMLSATSISDYLSLFIIRYLLVVSSRRPIVALLTSSLIAVLILIVAGILRVMFSSFYLDLYVIQEPLTEAVLIWLPNLIFYFSGIVVFAWMPILGISLLYIRLFNLLTPIVSKVQWALKGGKEHPLIAVGYVAGGIVFLIVIAWRLSLESQ